MTTKKQVPVVAAFHERQLAEGALDELRDAGFGLDQLGIATPDNDSSQTTHLSSQDASTRSVAHPAAGALAGGTLGGLIGATIATVLVPGAGPIVFAGVLAGIGAGAVVGAEAADFVSSALAMGIPEEEARRCEEELNGGGTVVIVTADGRGSMAGDILRRHGAHHVNLPN